MISNVDHIGIAVKDLAEAKTLYSNIFGVTEYHEETVADQGVHVASFQLGEVRIELTAPTGDDSPIAKFIAKRGEGIHHIAFRSNDITNDLESAGSKGIQLIFDLHSSFKTLVEEMSVLHAPQQTASRTRSAVDVGTDDRSHRRGASCERRSRIQLGDHRL